MHESEAVQLLDSIKGGSMMMDLAIYAFVFLVFGVPIIKKIGEGIDYLWGVFVKAVRKAAGIEEKKEANRRDNTDLLSEVQKMFARHEASSKETISESMKNHHAEMKRSIGEVDRTISLKMDNINTTISGQQENIAKLFERTEELGNRATALETRVNAR